ncbi:MAG: hypothetical protein ACQESD_04175 [Thermoplasmatota archaeon]
MDEKALQLAEKILEETRGHRTSSMLIFNTNFTQISKTNLILLKAFLDLESGSGVFIVLDRPHQYMSYLLNLHGVNQEELWFVDTVTHTSGIERKEGDNVNFLEGPFHSDNMLKAIESKCGGKDSENLLRLEKIDFLMIDNIATMLNYNSIEKVENFIISFKKFQKDHANITGAMTIDKVSNPELNEILIEHFDYMIDIDDLKKEVDGL